MKCVKCGEFTDEWILCQDCFDLTHKRRGDTMKWEVKRNGRRWTDGFPDKESAEKYAVIERKKMPLDVFEVIGM